MLQDIRKFNKSVIWFSVGLALLFSLSFVVPVRAEGATLFLSPASGTYSVGNTFSVSLRVNAGGQLINAADGDLVFDTAKLEIKSISKINSIFSLWVQEPIFSNTVGTISFAGGKPSPGYIGTSGEIFTIIFKAKISGQANVSFSSGSVLADDGMGTNVLANMISGSYNLFPREIETLPPEILPSTPYQTPTTPIVSSPTRSEEDRWYSNNEPEFSWKLPVDVTGVSLLLHKKPTASPGSISDGLMESKKFEAVEDGIWYFHIKFKNQYGWGKITHRKVLIDTTPPNPFEIEVQKEDPTDPQPILLFEATDDLSGIEYYKIKIGTGDSFPVVEEDLKTNPYKLSFQAPGRHPITIKAFDKAENFISSSIEIGILSIEKPKILEIPKRIGLGEALEIKGTTLPNVIIRIFIQKMGEEPVLSETESNSQGRWEFLYEKILSKGNYEIWAQAKNKRGDLSYHTERYALEVGLPPILKFGKIAIDYLTIMITLIILIIGAIAIILYIWHRVSLWQKRLRKETKEVAQSVTKAFRNLREEVQKQIKYLDKKPGLTESEKEVRDKLQETLDISERFIEKEIKDIKKELE